MLENNTPTRNLNPPILQKLQANRRDPQIRTKEDTVSTVKIRPCSNIPAP